jgi:hypothetical protein
MAAPIRARIERLERQPGPAPATIRFKQFGGLVWRGRALAGDTQKQASDLDSQRAPLAG